MLEILENKVEGWLCACLDFHYDQQYDKPYQRAYVSYDNIRFFSRETINVKELIQFQFTLQQYNESNGNLGKFTCPICGRLYSRIIPNPKYKK